MDCCCGPLNTAGFSSQLESGILPTSDHITYGGAFNEIEFQVGPKTQKHLDLHIGFARSSNPSSVSDKNINEFLAIFLKGGKDGLPRDERILNAVIILDISGSMSGSLSSQSKQTRLQLAKQAIKMFVSKLRPSDSFGIVTFNRAGYVIVKANKKSNVDIQNVFALIDSIKASGGTELSSGFSVGLNLLEEIMNNCKSKQECQNRLVMLTDVGDNSIPTTNQFISQVSNNNIHTTIIGISEQFRSDICESLTKIKGFNYFCAVKNQDLKKYLFQNFDWTFFPSSHNIQIKLKSENVKMFEVFGTPDSEDVSTYNDFAKKGQNTYIVTKITTGFPSQLLIENGIVKTVGGLVLVKLSPQNNMTSFKGQLELTYKTPKGETFNQTYPLEYNFPKNQQFFSEKCLEQAISIFYFVHEMKDIINAANSPEVLNNPSLRVKQIEALEGFRKLVPESKIKDIDGILTILKSYQN